MSDIIYRIAAAAFSNAPACPECVDVLVEARDEIERLRLTDAEREAIREAISAFDEFAGDEVYAAALRGLLDRSR